MTHTPRGYPDSERTGRLSTLRHLIASAARRWPTYLGITLAAASLFGGDDGPGGAFIVTGAALSYLVVAVLDRPGAVWPVVIAVFGVGAAGQAAGIAYWFVFGPLAVVFIVAGLLRGQWRRPGLFALQAPQMLAVGTVTLVAEYGGLAFAGYLVAAALLAHAAWDVVHWRANKIVTRSLAEFCMVLDSLLGLGIITLLLVA